MLWVRKDVECEQVDVPSVDLTVALLRLPDRSVLLEVFPDSCTSLARAHCFCIMTITFAALHLDVNTFA
jgi:hypothetical protein